MAAWGRRGPGGSRTRLTPLFKLLTVCFVCVFIGFLSGGGLFRRSQSQQHVHHEVVDSSPAATATKLQRQEVFTPSAVCLNTCKKARDGTCDDGRRKAALLPYGTSHRHMSAECDLGTDCDDCGPWTPSGPAPWADGVTPGPVSRLRDQGIDVRVQMLSAPAPIMFAYTEPSSSFDGGLAQGGGDRGFAQAKIAHSIFKRGCVNPLSLHPRSLFVDAGAGLGWFSVLAAKMGCRVVAFEPMPHFAAFLEYNLHLANVSHMVTVHAKAVGHEAGARDPEATITIDDVVREDVLLLKVAAEGLEWAVMSGARRLLSQQPVDHILLEYSPGVPERKHQYDGILRSIHMLADLMGSGYRTAYLGGGALKPRPAFFLEPIPALEEVTLDNLRYDVKDAMDLKAGSLGCPVDKALCKFPSWRCNSLPEDLNPRSLRATFDGSTSLWLARGREPVSFMPLNGTVGVLKLGDPEKTFFGDNGTTGLGGRLCMDIARTPEDMIKSRCPCIEPGVCGEEEEAVRKVAARGSIASNYHLPFSVTNVSSMSPQAWAKRNAAMAELLRLQIQEGLNATAQPHTAELSGCPIPGQARVQQQQQ